MFIGKKRKKKKDERNNQIVVCGALWMVGLWGIEFSYLGCISHRPAREAEPADLY